MKKIQKQLEKEKLRVEERRKEKAEAKAKRKIEREEAAKNGRKLSKRPISGKEGCMFPMVAIFLLSVWIFCQMTIGKTQPTCVPNICANKLVKIKLGALAF